jgi:hypothetical protein
LFRRWSLSLIAVSIFCLGLVGAVHISRQVQVRQGHCQDLRQRYEQLLAWRSGHLELQRRLQEWDRLWERVERSRLDYRSWRQYPLKVQDSLSPTEAANLLRLLSNDVNTGRDFWFYPQRVQAVPEVDRGGNATSRTKLRLQIRGQLMVFDRLAEGDQG